MCGRFTLRRADRLRIDRIDTYEFLQSPPRYNIAPTQKVWAVTETEDGERSLALFQWGLIPSWSSTPVGLINARAESIETKLSFKDAFKRRRCLIPADGFYEWERLGKAKQPYYFLMKDGAQFSFAGIWDEWRFNGNSISSCAIVTTTANEVLATIHNRMPVILSAAGEATWLRNNTKASDLHDLLLPTWDSEMEGFPVSQRVNSAQEDGPDLTERVEHGEGLKERMLF